MESIEINVINDTDNLTIPTTTTSDILMPADRAKLIGAFLLSISIIFLFIYAHVFSVMIIGRLWRTHSFFLWFISLSVTDMANLTIYAWCNITALYGRLLLPFDVCVYLGHAYNLFFLSAFAHFPVMATVRALAIACPLRSRNWLTVRSTSVQIGAVWLACLAGTVYAQKNRGNWVYYDPKTLGWQLADNQLYTENLDAFWIATPTLSVICSLIMYAVCIYKLRKHSAQISDSINPQQQQQQQQPRVQGQYVLQQQQRSSLTQQQQHNGEAEKNLIKIGLTLVLIFTLDIIFWRAESRVQQDWWWTPFSLTLVEIVMYGVNAVVLLVVSREIRRRSGLYRLFENGWTKIRKHCCCFCCTCCKHQDLQQPVLEEVVVVVRNRSRNQQRHLDDDHRLEGVATATKDGNNNHNHTDKNAPESSHVPKYFLPGAITIKVTAD